MPDSERSQGVNIAGLILPINLYLLEPKDGRNNRHEAWHDEYCRIHRSLWSWTTKCTSAGGEGCTVGKTRAVGQASLHQHAILSGQQ